MSSEALMAAAYYVLLAWLTVDALVVFSRYSTKARSSDRGSVWFLVLVLWLSIGAAIFLAYSRIGRFGAATVYVQWLGFAVMAFGVCLRFLAIYQLGKLHMPVVAIQPDHPLMDTGLYGLVRHPSYFGATLAFLGFGLALGSWASTLAALLGALLSYGYRIHVEEQALLQGLGARYRDYMQRTKRLIPWIY